MPKPIDNTATTNWSGTLTEGSGTVDFQTSHIGTFDVSWKARSEESGGTTTPEEFLAAAHSSCYAMQFSHLLAENGTPPSTVDVTATVTFEVGKGVTGSALEVTATVNDISDDDFQRIATEAKQTCPVSVALAGVDITLAANLT